MFGDTPYEAQWILFSVMVNYQFLDIFLVAFRLYKLFNNSIFNNRRTITIFWHLVSGVFSSQQPGLSLDDCGGLDGMSSKVSVSHLEKERELL